MRVSPRELQAVRRSGIVTRYALLDSVAYVYSELPAEGGAGTELDEPCSADHHGIVHRGEFRVLHDDGRQECFGPGTVFYVPAGPPAHRFDWSAGTIVGGFARLESDADTAPEALRARGYEIVRPRSVPGAPPASITLAGAAVPIRRTGDIDVEASVMGDWLFMRSVFGPNSGFGSPWCELEHWGVVAQGEIAIHYRDSVELASAGDAFRTPPGHRFEAVDGAVILDYTPVADLRGGRRASAWRFSAIEKALRDEGVHDSGAGSSGAVVRIVRHLLMLGDTRPAFLDSAPRSRRLRPA